MKAGFGPAWLVFLVGAALAGEPRPFAVRDAIELTRPVLDNEGSIVAVSPDGAYQAVLLRRGDVAGDATVYEARVYASGALEAVDGRVAVAPIASVSLSSRTNDAAISALQWSDGRTLQFLGVDGESKPQAYAFDVATRTLAQLTHAKRGVLEFATAGGRTVFLSPREAAPRDQARPRVIETTNYYALGEIPLAEYFDLNVIDARGEERLVRGPIHIDGVHEHWIAVAPSPSGRWAVVTMPVEPVPATWQRFAQGDRGLDARWVLQYALVDLSSGETRPLIDAPTGIFNNWPVSPAVLWSPDETSVILADAMVATENGPALRVAEINIADGAVRAIVDASPTPDARTFFSRWVSSVTWAEQGRLLEIVTFESASAKREARFFAKVDDAWRETTGPQPPAQLRVAEDAASPPRLVFPRNGGGEVRVADLNPQLGQIDYKPAQPISWADTKGGRIEGGLVLPPHLRNGERAPLVIQLREFNKRQFLADGPFTTAHAAQALAAQGIAVLQFRAPDTARGRDELEIQRRAIEGAIDHLHGQGLIDRNRVGLTGFSRTCWAVKHVLVSSKYPIAAAITADGVDGGYFQYLLRLDPLLRQTLEKKNGGAPFGPGLLAWTKTATPFNAHKIKTPLRAEGIGTVLGEWEMYAALRALEKPVELVFHPQGAHELVRPSEIAFSQQGAVDWYRFWLKGEEDGDPIKAAQYARWRKLRELQSAR